MNERTNQQTRVITIPPDGGDFADSYAHVQASSGELQQFNTDYEFATIALWKSYR